jgi:3-deoxy-7-phosphoheptulonate synthase
MIIVMRKDASQKDIDAIVRYIETHKLKAHPTLGDKRTVIGVMGNVKMINKDHLGQMPGVEKTMYLESQVKLASRKFLHDDTIVKVDDVAIGGNEIIVMAGPCAIESEEQLFETARAVQKAGAKVLRASAYKPRTSPYAFQGMGIEGLKLLKKVKKELGIVVETEVMDTRQVETVAKYVDIVRVGARNMQNFDLLKEVGKLRKPVIIKNGMSSTIEEFLLAAEYVMSEGNKNVILCERGIRTFRTETRNTLDLSAIPVLKELSHLPVIVDPSHAAGVKQYVAPMSKAAIAAGADGLLIEVHCDPSKALCDGKQALTTEDFENLMKDLRKVAAAVGRKL